MNPDWQRFLRASGARLDGEPDPGARIADFGDPSGELETAATGAGILTDLSHRSLFTLEGGDTLSFLQGQVTNDVLPAQEGRPVLAAHLTPKGRVIADLLVFPLAGGYGLDLSGDLAEPLLKRLTMFILNADVTLRDSSEDWVRLGIAGEGAAEAAAAVGGCGEFPAEGVVHGETGTIIPLPGSDPAFLAILPPDNGEAGWGAGTDRLRPVGRGAWDLGRIRAGMPEVTAVVSEAFLPQELNLEPVGGISYTKGCYTGQEVVARTKHLGRLKRRLYRVSGPPGLAPGQAVGIPDGEQGRGRVIRAAPGPGGGSEALAVLRIESVEEEEVLVPEGSNAPLRILDLPYTLPQATH